MIGAAIAIDSGCFSMWSCLFCVLHVLCATPKHRSCPWYLCCIWQLVSPCSWVSAGPPLPHLTQLQGLPLRIPTDPATLPPGWKCWSDPLQLFAVVNPPWVAAGYKLNPWGGLHTGHVDMMWVKQFKGRLQALDMQIKAEKGEHMNLPHVHHERVSTAV